MLAYAGILCAVALVAVLSIGFRAPLKVDVIRDRAGIAREASDGRIENVYRLQVMNTRERGYRLELGVRGAAGLARLEALAEPQSLEIAPLSSRMIPVRVRAEPGSLRGSQPIEFIVSPVSTGESHVAIVEKSRFLIP